jgi:hypothetical protein
MGNMENRKGRINDRNNNRKNLGKETRKRNVENGGEEDKRIKLMITNRKEIERMEKRYKI